jgi:hypothetical protein
MSYAMLSEVYGPNGLDEITKKRKKKKSEKKEPKPLSPQEMNSELISENDKQLFNQRNTPRSRIYSLGVNPYDTEDYLENSLDRQPLGNQPTDAFLGPLDPLRRDPRTVQQRIYGDPEYREFLEYKRSKNKQNDQNNQGTSDNNEQFNELLLYVFTGFFLLMMYDNVFQLGQRY